MEQVANKDDAGHPDTGPTRHGHKLSHHKAHPFFCNSLSWLHPFSCISLSFHRLFLSRVHVSTLLISSLPREVVLPPHQYTSRGSEESDTESSFAPGCVGFPEGSCTPLGYLLSACPASAVTSTSGFLTLDSVRE